MKKIITIDWESIYQHYLEREIIQALIEMGVVGSGYEPDSMEVKKRGKLILEFIED